MVVEKCDTKRKTIWFLKFGLEELYCFLGRDSYLHFFYPIPTIKWTPNSK